MFHRLFDRFIGYFPPFLLSREIQAQVSSTIYLTMKCNEYVLTPLGKARKEMIHCSGRPNSRRPLL